MKDNLAGIASDSPFLKQLNELDSNPIDVNPEANALLSQESKSPASKNRKGKKRRAQQRKQKQQEIEKEKEREGKGIEKSEKEEVFSLPQQDVDYFFQNAEKTVLEQIKNMDPDARNRKIYQWSFTKESKK